MKYNSKASFIRWLQQHPRKFFWTRSLHSCPIACYLLAHGWTKVSVTTYRWYGSTQAVFAPIPAPEWARDVVLRVDGSGYGRRISAKTVLKLVM